jgi:L-rhamnose isomerase / sugar isomerase
MPSDVELALSALQIELPSWGFGDSGTRFATFRQTGYPRNVFERIDDAACVHALTGSADRVALHFPWDSVEDLDALDAHLADRGLSVGAINPNLFQDPDYRVGSITNASEWIREKAVGHLLECVEIGVRLGATAQSLWLPDGTNYPGQDDFGRRRDRLLQALHRVYAALPNDHRLLIEYKPFEPAFYGTDIPDWGAALAVCREIGDRAEVLVDLGHHLQGTNVEQIVAILMAERRLGGLHFNARKYADDDLVVGSINPFELFLILCELTSSGRPLPRLTIDQAHNVEGKIEAMILSVLNIQHAYAKALIVDRTDLTAAQENGDVLGGYQVLRDAFETDVRSLCAKVRSAKGAADDPISALRESGYLEAKAAERAVDGAVGVRPGSSSGRSDFESRR